MNETAKVIIDIFKKKDIEIINIDENQDNETLITFLCKGQTGFITKDGMIYIDELNSEDKVFIKKLIVYAQKITRINRALPIKNLNINLLKKISINGFGYYLLLQIKNQCLLFRENGIFGIEYILCEEKITGINTEYKNIVKYKDITIAEHNLANRAQLYIKPMNCFTLDELKTILYYTQSIDKSQQSKKLLEETKKIQNTILDILKEEENEKR